MNKPAANLQNYFMLRQISIIWGGWGKTGTEKLICPFHCQQRPRYLHIVFNMDQPTKIQQ
jgi:hypothetical protein